MVKSTEKYGHTLISEAEISTVGDWIEVSLPITDASGDGMCFYMQRDGDMISFTDDGWTLAEMNMRGIQITDSLIEHVAAIVGRFSAEVTADGQIVLKSNDSCADGMNRFTQALLAISEQHYSNFLLTTSHKQQESLAPEQGCTLFQQ